MQTYGMASVDDDQEIDCYHQYIAQTTYRCERPEDGDHMRMQSVGCEAYSRHIPNVNHHSHHSHNYGDTSSSYPNVAYNPMRPKRNAHRYNYQRNGLYYNEPREMRGSGDCYNRLPGGLHDQLHTWYP